MLRFKNWPSWPQNIAGSGCCPRCCRQPCCCPPPMPSCPPVCCEPRCSTPFPPPCPSPCPPPCPPRYSTPCPPPCIPPCPPPCPTPCRNRPTCRPRCQMPCSRSATPYVVCCGRESNRCLSERMCVSGCGGFCPPFTLTGLEVADSQLLTCVQRRARGPSPELVEVTIPLIAWVCDAHGCTCCGSSQISVCVRMPTCCLSNDGTLMASACLRLINAGQACDGLSFCVRLEVLVEVYLVRIDSSSCRPNLCPPLNLPMFPQPRFPC